MLKILLLVGGVNTQEKMIVRDFVDQNIVDEAAMFVKQGRVMRLPRLQPRGVIRRNIIDKLRCLDGP